MVVGEGCKLLVHGSMVAALGEVAGVNGGYWYVVAGVGGSCWCWWCAGGVVLAEVAGAWWRWWKLLMHGGGWCGKLRQMWSMVGSVGGGDGAGGGCWWRAGGGCCAWWWVVAEVAAHVVDGEGGGFGRGCWWSH